MASRLQLHEELCELLGSRNVYYQSPESVKMSYPAIRYSKTGVNTNNANDKIYKSMNQYNVIVIDPDPDSEIPDKILNHFQMCRYDRGYTSNNLNHDALTLYY